MEEKKENTKVFVAIQVASVLVISAIVLSEVVFDDKDASQNNANQEAKQKEEVHYHAGFAVFENGEKVDFSKPQYMTVSPCSGSTSSINFLLPSVRAHGDTNTSETAETKKKAYNANEVHLHDGVGDVVHVHAEGITWHDLFHSLEYSTKDFEKVAVNGEVQDVDTVLERDIRKHERVVFIKGEESYSSEMLKQVPSKDRIVEVGNQSENCSS